MQRKCATWSSAVCCVIAVLLSSAPAQAEISAPGYTIRQLIEPSAFHGVHGLAFDAADNLYAGSVVGQGIYRVDTRTGAVDIIVSPPEGMADDLVFLPDGTMVWTSIEHNAVRARQGDGPIRTLAELASVNSIAYRKSDGRLFVAQVFGGDGLWEAYLDGKAPRNILRDIGGLNGFDIGPDGWIYGPLWFRNQVVKIHPDTGELKVVADGLRTPAAANFDSRWNLYVLDTALGTVNRIDIKTGGKSVVARLATSLDNLAVDSQDRLFVSNMADNAIHEVDVASGTTRQIVKGKLAIPFSVAAVADGNHDQLYVADVFAYRSIHGESGRVEDVQRAHAAGADIGYPINVAASERHVVLCNYNGSVQLFNRANGELLREISGLHQVSNAIELNDGTVLVAHSDKLTRIAKDSDEQETIVEGLQAPLGMALNNAGNVYISEVDGGTISLVDVKQGKRKVVASGLSFPQALAMDRDGALLTVELGHRRLVRVDPRNGRSLAIADNLPVGLLGTGAGRLPIGIAVGRGGAIYVTSDIENSIYKLTR